MSVNNLFRINVGFLVKANVGVYREFTIEDPLFTLDENWDAENLSCTIRVNRVQEGILVSAHCGAYTTLECVRCLEPYKQFIECQFDELFSFRLRENVDAEQFLPESGYLDLAPLIREYLIIEVPICPVCKEDCKGLCPVCGKNLNLGECNHPEED